MNDYSEVLGPWGSCSPCFELVSSGSNSGFHENFWRHRRTELDSCLVIPEYTDPIRFGTMMDGYREVFAALKGRGRALPAPSFEFVNLKLFSSGSNSGFRQTFIRMERVSVINIRLALVEMCLSDLHVAFLGT
jgi:hypothetical protein